MKCFPTHAELWLNEYGEKPTVLSATHLSYLNREIQGIPHKTILMLVAPSGIAGADVKEMVKMSKRQAMELSLLGSELVSRIVHHDSLVVGYFDRCLLGGGLEIALACDLIAVGKELKFGFPEVTLGITPGFFGIELGVSKNPSLTGELALTGKVVRAAAYEQRGFFNHVEANWDALMNLREETIKQLSKCSQRAISSAKRRYTRAYLKQLPFEMPQDFSLDFNEYDQEEGMAAFVEKRVPRFFPKTSECDSKK